MSTSTRSLATSQQQQQQQQQQVATNRRATVVSVEGELRKILSDIEAHSRNMPPVLRPAGYDEDDEEDDEPQKGVHSVGSFRASSSPREGRDLRARAKPRFLEHVVAREQLAAPPLHPYQRPGTAPAATDDSAYGIRALMTSGLPAPPTSARVADGPPPRSAASATPRQRIAMRMAHGEHVGHAEDDEAVVKLCNDFLEKKRAPSDGSTSERRQRPRKPKQAPPIGATAAAPPLALPLGGERFKRSAYFCKALRPTHPSTPPNQRRKRASQAPVEPDAAIAVRVSELLSAQHELPVSIASGSTQLRSVRLPAAPTVTKRSSGRYKISRPRLIGAAKAAEQWHS